MRTRANPAYIQSYVEIEATLGAAKVEMIDVGEEGEGEEGEEDEEEHREDDTVPLSQV